MRPRPRDPSSYRSRRLMTHRLFWLVPLLLAACSNEDPPPPPPATVTIGPDGGTVAIEGCRLIVPPLALTREHEITITPSDRVLAEDGMAFSPVFHFEPEGLVFRRPARLEIDITGDASMVRPSFMLLTAPEGEALEEVGDRVEGRMVVGEIHHFSEAGLEWVPPMPYRFADVGDRFAIPACDMRR